MKSNFSSNTSHFLRDFRPLNFKLRNLVSKCFTFVEVVLQDAYTLFFGSAPSPTINFNLKVEDKTTFF